jgi:hypothetical protein
MKPADDFRDEVRGLFGFLLAIPFANGFSAVWFVLPLNRFPQARTQRGP